MRIINAMFGRDLGGIEQALLDYTQALSLAGHEVLNIIHPHAAIRSALVTQHLAFKAIYNIAAWDPLAMFKLRTFLRHWKPGACIAHGNRAISLLARSSKTPLIAPLHNYKIKCRHVTAAFYPTHDLLNYALSQNMQKEQLYYVPNMVRCSAHFHPRAYRTPPIIGAMGRMVAKKGFDVFIHALSILKTQNIPFRAMLAGDGPDKSALQVLSGEKGLESILTFTGWIENKKSFFDSVDIFCLPSLHEPFGIVLLEAMAEGLPIISADSEGPISILNNGVDGLLVPKSDAAALAQAIKTLLDDPRRAALLAQNAIDSVRAKYDLPVVSAKLDLAVRAVCRL